MIFLEQQKNSKLIASSQSLLELAEKAEARILVISDSHGNRNAVEKILNNEGSSSDAMIFCGDGFGDVLAILEEVSLAGESHPLLSKIPKVIAMVRGNGDEAFYRCALKDGKTGIIEAAETSIFSAAGKKIFVSHGHLYNVYFEFDSLANEAKKMECQIACFGHTHKKHASFESGVLFLNPGSASRPRDLSNPSYCIISFSKDSKLEDTSILFKEV